jgi:LCP family protein required for cell wall assembly
MASGRPPGDDRGPGRARRRSIPNESGLRALGEQSATSSPSQPSPGGANESRLEALGAQIDRANVIQRRRRSRPGFRRNGKRRWSRRRKVVTGIVGVLVLLLLLAGGLYGYLQYRFDQINKVHVTALEQAVNGGPFNVLVLGSDSRVGQNSTAFGSAAQVGGQRSDVIMIWHVDPATRQITVMSIPRDTLVSMVGHDVNEFGTFNRINASYDSGPNLLVQTIEDNFGIPINHVVQVNFGGFEGAVNSLGGVWMNFPYPARDSLSGLNITTPGCQLLNGAAALSVARSRHYEYYANGYWHQDGTGDFGRIQRQDAFLKSLIDAARSKLNPLTINAFLGSLPQGVSIDDQFSLNGVLGLVEAFHSFNPDALNGQTLPTTSVGYVSPWGDVLFVDQPAAQQMLVSIFGTELTSPKSPPPNTSLESTPPPAIAPTATAPAAASGATTTAPAQPAPTSQPSFDPAACSPH